MVGKLISFNTHSGSDRETLYGAVSNYENLGLVVISNWTLYELKKLINIKAIS